MKALVAYFSAESGRTANAAKSLAEAIGADLLEIKPEKPYTSSDLNYMNPLARCNREHITKKQVPVSGRVENFAEYDTVLIGFPISYAEHAAEVYPDVDYYVIDDGGHGFYGNSLDDAFSHILEYLQKIAIL